MKMEKAGKAGMKQEAGARPETAAGPSGKQEQKGAKAQPGEPGQSEQPAQSGQTAQTAQSGQSAQTAQTGRSGQTPQSAQTGQSKQPERKNAAGKKETSKCGRKEEKKQPEAGTAGLEKEVAALQAQLQQEKESYLRLMAEFENFRRRTAAERLELVGSAAAETLKGLLPVLDDCERAIQLLAASSDEAAKEGTALIYNKLLSYLRTRGLEKIEAKGTRFDTDFHEAVAQLPVTEAERKGKVYDVVETGYLLNGKVLRFAKVVVGV